MPNKIHQDVKAVAHCFNDIKTVKKSAKSASEALEMDTKGLVAHGAANIATAWAIAPVATLIAAAPVLGHVPLLSTIIGAVAKKAIISDINPHLVNANDIQGWGEFKQPSNLAFEGLDYAKTGVSTIAGAVSEVVNPIKPSGLQTAMEETDKVWRRTEGIPRSAMIEMREEVKKLHAQVDKLAKKANSAFDGIEAVKGPGGSVTPADVASALFDKEFRASGSAALDYKELFVKNIKSPKNNFMSIKRRDVLNASIKAKRELYELDRVLKNKLFPAVQLGANESQKSYARGEGKYVSPKAWPPSDRLQDIPFIDD